MGFCVCGAMPGFAKAGNYLNIQDCLEKSLEIKLP